MRLRQYDALERELRRLHLFIRIDRHGNARRNWAGYLLCAATVALVLGAGWWADNQLPTLTGAVGISRTINSDLLRYRVRVT